MFDQRGEQKNRPFVITDLLSSGPDYAHSSIVYIPCTLNACILATTPATAPDAENCGTFIVA